MGGYQNPLGVTASRCGRGLDYSMPQRRKLISHGSLGTCFPHRVQVLCYPMLWVMFTPMQFKPGTQGEPERAFIPHEGGILGVFRCLLVFLHLQAKAIQNTCKRGIFCRVLYTLRVFFFIFIFIFFPFFLDM